MSTDKKSPNNDERLFLQEDFEKAILRGSYRGKTPSQMLDSPWSQINPQWFLIALNNRHLELLKHYKLAPFVPKGPRPNPNAMKPQLANEGGKRDGLMSGPRPNPNAMKPQLANEGGKRDGHRSGPLPNPGSLGPRRVPPKPSPGRDR